MQNQCHICNKGTSFKSINLKLSPMDHVVSPDTGTLELESLINGHKSMILRGADVIKVPYGCVNEGDILYFISSSSETEVRARGVVSYVFNSGRLSVEESFETVIRNQDKLQLPDTQFDRWAGKRYLVLIGLREIEEVKPFSIENDIIDAYDDWIPVGKISLVAID